jgi:undecaprenyl-phosphate 4-deoxy-4-formamido-L-arabinose transferase
MDISIVIPVFNAEKSISKTIEDLMASDFLQSNKWELILVDDFSQDNSFKIIQEKSKKHSNILGLSLHKNVGQHSATLAGIQEASGKILITMDDDGEHPVEFIPKLIQALDEDSKDIAFAIPETSNKSILRKAISGLFKKSAQWFSDGYGNGSAFRAIKKSIYSRMESQEMPFVFIDEILAWYTKNVIFIPCTYKKSMKSSSYGSKRLFGLYINIMYTYSSFPAQFLTRIGILGSVFSFAIGVFYIVKKIYFKAQIGFTSIAVSILFSASIILLGLGIIAQYIYRQNRLLNKFPQYSIRNRTDEE